MNTVRVTGAVVSVAYGVVRAWVEVPVGSGRSGRRLEMIYSGGLLLGDMTLDPGGGPHWLAPGVDLTRTLLLPLFCRVVCALYPTGKWLLPDA